MYILYRYVYGYVLRWLSTYDCPARMSSWPHGSYRAMAWETRPCAFCGQLAGFENHSLGPLLGPLLDHSTGAWLVKTIWIVNLYFVKNSLKPCGEAIGLLKARHSKLNDLCRCWTLDSQVVCSLESRGDTWHAFLDSSSDLYLKACMLISLWAILMRCLKMWGIVRLEVITIIPRALASSEVLHLSLVRCSSKHAYASLRLILLAWNSN